MPLAPRKLSSFLLRGLLLSRNLWAEGRQFMIRAGTPPPSRYQTEAHTHARR